jgi:uncharacterized protein (DUF1015 family)
MGLVKPFRALRYDPETAGSLDDLVTPPHDVLTPERRERLLAASPFNAVRLVRPDDAAQAGRDLALWRAQGVLVREAEPSVWLLEEDFLGPDGLRRSRRGLVARVRLERYERGVILPHERTFERSKEERLPLLRATRTKLSPIFLLHDGPGAAEPPARPPDLEATLDGVTSRLWRLPDAETVASVRPPLVIADGHHRYETALRFHEEAAGEETAYVLATLVSKHDPGVEIFPTHRLAASVPQLDGALRLTELAGGAQQGLAALAALPRDRPAFVLLHVSGATLVEADGPALDSALVDRLPLESVRFTASAAEAERAVVTGDAAAAFLVRAPTIDDVDTLARAGERLPAKSTYFFPKITCGLLFAPFDE